MPPAAGGFALFSFWVMDNPFQRAIFIIVAIMPFTLTDLIADYSQQGASRGCSP